MKQLLSLTATLLLMCTTTSAKVIHVAKTGSDQNKGTVSSPFLTITKATQTALSGDSIIIGKGTYREWVSPNRSGISERDMISFIAAKGEEVYIKGSEQVKNWTKGSDGVWTAEVDNAIFGGFNPFTVKLYGDWLLRGKSNLLGEVYINNKALTQKFKKEDLAGSINSWFSTVDDKKTTIYANFGKLDPNKELSEINVRESCFFPKKTGVNYIRVEGIKISQAATQWAPPTADQPGAIGPNWSKGWVIENCEVTHSKCVGIAIGKERASGQNRYTRQMRIKPFTKVGFSYEIEAIIKASELGWSKELIGSHKIINNKISDCGQAGIVGHLGCAFSTISGNEIVNINQNKDIHGHETGCIKLHAAIDVIIENNVLINGYRGLWLDWQAQGTHVRGNIFSGNSFEDLFIEVSHGPTLVYNNILLSSRAMTFNAQGIALFNNLFGGDIRVISSTERYTPYHIAHSTKLKGFYNNAGGDIKLYNNLFLPRQATGKAKSAGKKGLSAFDAYPIFNKNLAKNLKIRDLDYLTFKFPVWTGGNAYYGSYATPFNKEVNHTMFGGEGNDVKLEKKDGAYYINYDIDAKQLSEVKTVKVNTDMLGMTFVSEAFFENPDGSDFENTLDFFGEKRADKPVAGPFESAIGKRAIWKR